MFGISSSASKANVGCVGHGGFLGGQDNPVELISMQAMQVLDGSDLVYIVWIKSNSDWTSFVVVVVVVVRVVIVNNLVSML